MTFTCIHTPFSPAPDQLARANDHDQQPPIDAREYPVFLATPPGAYEAQLLALPF
jgi:hypothetical protein